jgi:hypothetical protein
MATTAGRKSGKPAGKPGTVSGYLAQLPADRRDTISEVRRVILDHSDDLPLDVIGEFVAKVPRRRTSNATRKAESLIANR